ncbi:MAG: 23S rRNA (uracil(1939)-C(5))-methyltransferase RlmD [Clostridium sp.]|nr:23S rRNA (uracil(1939)-C(5))-methyltransferase RlmD [Clostridium sp.]
MKNNIEYEFNIVDTEFPGIGIAYEENRKIQIKGTVPGQKVTARIVKVRKDYAKAKLIKVIEKIPSEIEVKCPHFENCGGCTYPFLSYNEQLDLKEKQIKRLFGENEISNFEYLGISPSPKQVEYRNKMEFSFGDMKKGGELTLGMHAKNVPFGVVTTDKCNIIHEDFKKILTAVLNYAKEENLPYYKVVKHVGFLRNLVIRRTENTGEILVNLLTTSQAEMDEKKFADEILKLKLEAKVVGILHTINDGLSDTVAKDELYILHGRDYIVEKVLGLNFKISPFSFFQTNTAGAEKLYSIVMDFMGDAAKKTVFDLYCGTGTIGQIAARNAEKVVGVELIEEAVASANENAKENGLLNCKFIAGDVAKVINEIKEKPDIIILDPPRPGVHPKAMKYVIDFAPKEIVYVSCNPKTLVNDLHVLKGNGYELEKVELMDMFPGTGHVEVVVKLKRKDS